MTQYVARVVLTTRDKQVGDLVGPAFDPGGDAVSFARGIPLRDIADGPTTAWVVDFAATQHGVDVASEISGSSGHPLLTQFGLSEQQVSDVRASMTATVVSKAFSDVDSVVAEKGFVR